MTGHWMVLAAAVAVVEVVNVITALFCCRVAVRAAREQAYWDGVESTARAYADQQERLWEEIGYPRGGPPAFLAGGRHEARPAVRDGQADEPCTSEWAAALIADVETWNARHQLNGGPA